MLLYIITNTMELYRSSDRLAVARLHLETLSGDACVALHYSQVNMDLVNRLRPWAIIHSGGSSSLEDMPPDYWQIIKEFQGPQLGICAGHQFIACAFGSRMQRMRPLHEDEPDPAGVLSSRPGQFQEWGVYPVTILKEDPLFTGCSPIIRVQEYHFCEVTDLGSDLELLANSATCHVQAFRHRTRPIYGTQFHPEIVSEIYSDGTQVLLNFFNLARQHPTNS